MSSDDERKSGEYGDSSQLNNWILDSGATCHMMPEVMGFIPGSLEYMDPGMESETYGVMWLIKVENTQLR